MAVLSSVASVGRVDRCRYCAAHPDLTRCTYCTGRRRRAGRLADQGRSVQEVAREMRITERWARKLLTDEYDMREREALRCDEVPVKIVLDAVERWQERAPEYNTWSELARRMRYRSEVTLRRALGAVTKDGRRRSKVDIELAGRVLRQMGFTPCEFDWL
jgi:hypothetical protein